TLVSVSAVVSNDVWAAGNYNSGTTPLLLTLHWNGTQWVNVPNPNPGSNYAEDLQAVEAVASNDVWAVGFYRHNSPQALIMHWDGAQWSVVAVPSGIVRLDGISAISTNDVWAVGSDISTPASAAYH